MKRKILVFVALAITILYGASFSVLQPDVPKGYAPIGGAVVALMWIAVGMFGHARDRRSESSEKGH
ncbi:MULTISPECIES: hypothetical protein [Micrococcaceae]|uniref:hypothetical protein n=1 Tax=unclassified Kocuria TaxID=2649579 RepID=UPI0010133544|nr:MULTISPECIES: hypothetical protein [unclassified Kocuria]